MKQRKKQMGSGNRQQAIGNGESAIRNPKSEMSSRGMTLIELLVSLGVLSLILLAVNTIIVQSQRAVTISTTIMRANQTAGALAQVFRRDFRQVSQRGFLCITMRDQGADPPTPRLIMTQEGVSRSLFNSMTGTGKLICYGMTDNQAPGAPGEILWRQGWVLKDHAPDDPDDDVLPYDAYAYEVLSRPQVDFSINNLLASPTMNPVLKVPPESLGDVKALWQCLSARCRNLSIMWTDGSTSGGSVNWYGIRTETDGTVTIVHKDAAWTGKTIAALDNDEFEFDGDGSTANATQLYRALWTSENQSNWPKAVRIRFELDGSAVWKEALPDNTDTFEVICPLGG